MKVHKVDIESLGKTGKTTLTQAVSSNPHYAKVMYTELDLPCAFSGALKCKLIVENTFSGERFEFDITRVQAAIAKYNSIGH